MIKCKKALTINPDKPLKFVTEIIESVPSDGVVIEIQYSGICHTDIDVKNDKFDYGNCVIRLMDLAPEEYPDRVLGHEITGKIVNIGADVKDFKVNDEIIVYSWAACRNCAYCKDGNSSLCLDNEIAQHDIGIGKIGGGFSTHLVLPDASKYLIKRGNIDPKIASLLSCSALTAYNGLQTIDENIKYVEKISKTAEILIIGAGGLGQWGISFCRYLYPNAILTVADVSAEKLETAKKLGAHKVVQWSKSMQVDDMIKSIVDKKHAIIDFVGSSTTSTTAVNCLSRGSILVLIGMMGGTMSASPYNIADCSITIKGVRTGNFNMMKEMVKIVEIAKIQGPDIKLYKFDDVNIALNDLQNGKIKGRAVLEISYN